MRDIQRTMEENSASVPYKAFKAVYYIGKVSRIRYWLIGILITICIGLMLPWTQNVRAIGSVTTLYQQDRPQELNTIIPGRIVKWYVKEGDYVKKGDTLVALAEVKDAYLDTGLISRTREQMMAKMNSITAYSTKAGAMSGQAEALRQARDLKVQQLQNKLGQLSLKLLGDSMDLVAAENAFNIAEEQYRRQRIMRDSGLASLVQLEQRNQNFQMAQAKKVSASVKLTNTRTDIVNTRLELSQVMQEYSEKIYKSVGDKASAESDVAAGRGELAKLSNQYANYIVRASQYYILAPQDGQVVQASKAGINEMVKEGDKIAEIVPDKVHLAVEMFVRPVDMPLLEPGQKVRFIFDGFPAIVFSGWPSASFGTFGGHIVAIESSVSANGKFRVLVGEDSVGKRWPVELKMGAGARSIALLKNVPIWYELWRNINGFPPDYYKTTGEGDDKKKKK